MIGKHNGSSSPFREFILSRINFAPDILTPGERQWLFTMWFYSLFFDSIMKTRPILTMLGEQGSGKSSTLRWLGLLLYGSSFDVTPLPHKAEDFDAAITNAEFVAIDNADSRCRWLEDRLAVIATGGKLKRRLLYTTNTLVDIPIRCALAITSRTPRFRREDISERLLIMKLARLPAHRYQGESELIRQVLDHRNEMMAEVVGQIQEILQALRASPDQIGCAGTRMADFGKLSMKVAHSLGRETEVQAMFAKLGNEQSSFTLEDDVIYELLSLWVVANPDTEITYGDLCDGLTKLAGERALEFIWKGRHRSFAQRMRNLRPSLERFFEITERSAKGGKNYYRFRKVKPKDDQTTPDTPSHPSHPSHPERVVQDVN